MKQIMTAKKTTIVLLILIMTFTWMFGTAVTAFGTTYTNATGTITAESGANVRSDAGTSYDLVISLAKGTKVDVVGDKKGTDGYTWYKIKYDGKTGYVRSDLITVKNGSSSSGSSSSETTPQEPSGTDYSNTTATITASDGVNVRSDAGTSYDVVVSLAKGTVVDVTGDKKGDDGYTWYKIKFEGQTGYVRSDLLTLSTDNGSQGQSGSTDSEPPAVTPTGKAMSDSEFNAYIKAQGFPASYQALLKDLHKQYPYWIFQAADTGLDWDSVLAKESVVGRSLVSSSFPDYYKSQASGAYNKETGRYTSFDSGGWNSASEELIAYYLDPRNFLNESGIFQFIDHNYDSSSQTLAGIKNVVSGTFLSADYKAQEGENSSYKTYANVLKEAGKSSGVNPYVLASMIIIEQGAKGNGGCISGTVKGYEGYFNYYNIGAYKSGSMSAVTRGVWYASQSGSYGRPWDTRAKSIIGGAGFYYDNYVKQKKDTLYFKKWNVMNGSINVGVGQYMTNVMGAESEASQLKKAYSGIMNSDLIFKIPVYSNMPEYPCEKPSKKTSISEAVISGVSNKTYTGGDITPAPTVKLGDKNLTAGSDYTVTYENNTDVGTASVLVRGTGEYKDTISKDFKIRPIGTTLSAVTAESDHIKVSWNKQSQKMSAERIASYQIQIASDKEFTKDTKKVTVSGYDTSSEKISMTIKSGKNYYVRIRTIAKSESTKYYSTWSDYMTVKYVKPEDRVSIKKATVTGIKDKTYNGKSRTGSITVTLKKKTLKKGTDYTVKYSSNKNVGTATVKISGIGEYKGTIEKTFKIKPKTTSLKSLSSDAGTITVKWNKQSAKMPTSRVRGYQLYISTSKNFASGTNKSVKYKGYKTVEKTIKGFKSGTTYYVKIRTYIKVDGKTYYSFWSKAKKIKVK